jgi:hypothetical protein
MVDVGSGRASLRSLAGLIDHGDGDAESHSIERNPLARLKT